jgi:hypothetical protein
MIDTYIWQEQRSRLASLATQVQRWLRMLYSNTVLPYTQPRYDNVLREPPLGRRWPLIPRPPAVTGPSQRRNEVGGTRLALVPG